jgi:hypothetical protein
MTYIAGLTKHFTTRALLTGQTLKTITKLANRCNNTTGRFEALLFYAHVAYLIHSTMKPINLIAIAFMLLLISSCDMDGANNPANSAESSDKTHTGLEMTGSPADPTADSNAISSPTKVDSTVAK